MSTLRVSTIQDTAGSNSSTPSAIANGIAKAWVNFNGTGTVAIRAQYNVSSITDNGVGDYTVNFTSAFADANYAITTLGGNDSYDDGYTEIFGRGPNFSQLASSVRLQGTNNFSGAGYRSDIIYAHAAFFR